MKIELYDKNQPVTIEEINKVENILGVKFTQEYIDFLLEQNGGVPKACNFIFPDRSNSSTISEFHPIGDMKGNLYRWNRFRDFSEDFITIADDSGGNQILLRVKGEKIGEIYFWYHDIDPDDEDPMHFLANSLSGFLSMLEE